VSVKGGQRTKKSMRKDQTVKQREREEGRNLTERRTERKCVAGRTHGGDGMSGENQRGALKKKKTWKINQLQTRGKSKGNRY